MPKPGNPTGNPTGYVDDNLDISAYGTVVDYLLENTPQLRWPESVRTYARMRHDPQLAAILQVYNRPIDRAHWAVDGAGCRDEVTARVADDLGLPILDGEGVQSGARRRRFVFAEHRRIAGLYRVFGHMFFAQAWEPAAPGWRLAMVQERMPQTVASVGLHPDGTIRHVEQEAGQVGARNPRITADDHQLVYYVREREGSNYFGQSLLRASYGPWLIKDQVLRVHATSIRRFGLGIPSLQALPGTNVQPQQMAEAQRVIGSYRASEHSNIVAPPGFRVAWEGLTGSVPDALAFLQYLDRQMTRSTLTSILDMATAERGSRALGETVMDLMVLAQQSDANFIADTATSQIVIPLVDANWGDDEPAPKITVGDVGADVELTAQDMNWLLQFGGLRPDSPMRDYIRERYGMPPEDPEDPLNVGRDAAESGATAPPTTGGEAQ